MFGFFKKKNFDRKVPKDYLHLINQQQYDQLLDLSLQYFKEKRDEVLKIEDGTITAKNEEDEEVRYGLDNLVRMLAQQPAEEWESILYEHFNKTSVDSNYLQYYKKDYEASKQFLKVLVKDEAILNSEFGKDVVSRQDFEGTCTVLVMDYDNQFRYLRYEDVAEWEATQDELFQVALDNISQEEVNIHKADHEDNIEMFLFFSGDFSAVQMIEFERNADFALGKYGSIIAIPNKGTAFATPINDNNIKGRLDVLVEPVHKFFSEDPSNITMSLYWYYEGKFEKFPEVPAEQEGYVSIEIPAALLSLANEE